MQKGDLCICTKDITYFDKSNEQKVINAGYKFVFERDLGSHAIITRWNRPFIIEKEFVRKAEESDGLPK